MSERLQTISRHLNSRRTCCNSSEVIFNPTLSTLTVDNPSCSQFRYTAGGNALTFEQRQFYERNGFIVIKNVVPEEKLAIYRQRFQDLCSGKEKIFGMTVMRDIAIAKSEFREGEQAITKLQDFQWDDVLFEYCKLPEVLHYVQDITGPNIMGMHTMLINKPPDPGTLTSRHPMHQDLYYFPFRPADRIVCAWTAMQTINRANGCLVVVPGSHTGDMMEHDYPKWEGGVNKLYHGIVDFDPERNERVWVEMDEGDTVFFHPLLVHGSGANRTEGFRKSISCHYAASECEYVETGGSKQEKIAQEVIELAQKRTKQSVVIPYRDIWKYRARLVAGEQINL